MAWLVIHEGPGNDRSVNHLNHVTLDGFLSRTPRPFLLYSRKSGEPCWQFRFEDC